MNLIPIKYIGKKARQRDTVAGTGLEWLPRQIHVVPAVIAQKLLRHPDVWEEAPPEDVEADPAAVGLVVDSLPETPDQSVEQRPPLDLPDLNAMTKDALAEYAQRQFNAVLDKRRGKDALVKEVMDLRNSRAGTPL